MYISDVYVYIYINIYLYLHVYIYTIYTHICTATVQAAARRRAGMASECVYTTDSNTLLNIITI